MLTLEFIINVGAVDLGKSAPPETPYRHKDTVYLYTPYIVYASSWHHGRQHFAAQFL
jgi:hypothetical protein